MALGPGLRGKGVERGYRKGKGGSGDYFRGLIPDSRSAVWPARSVANAHTGNWRSGLSFFTRDPLAHSRFILFSQTALTPLNGQQVI